MAYISSNRSGSGCFSGIGCLIFSGLFLIGSFYFMQWLYIKLWYVAPVFFVLALAINWQIVAASGRGYLRLLTRNPINGIITGVLAFFLFPFLCILWFLGALGGKKIEKMQQEYGKNWGFGSFAPNKTEMNQGNEYSDFEELESKPILKKRDEED